MGTSMKITMLLVAVLVLLVAVTQVQAANVANVKIKDNSFSPQEIRIMQGDSVRWTNEDAATHDVSFRGDKSPVLSKGETYSKMFDTPGTFEYKCDIHPWMKGKVIVR